LIVFTTSIFIMLLSVDIIIKEIISQEYKLENSGYILFFEIIIYNFKLYQKIL